MHQKPRKFHTQTHTQKERNEKVKKVHKALLFGERRVGGGAIRARHSTCWHMEVDGPHVKNPIENIEKKFGLIIFITDKDC